MGDSDPSQWWRFSKKGRRGFASILWMIYTSADVFNCVLRSKVPKFGPDQSTYFKLQLRSYTVHKSVKIVQAEGDSHRHKCSVYCSKPANLILSQVGFLFLIFNGLCPAVVRMLPATRTNFFYFEICDIRRLWDTIIDTCYGEVTENAACSQRSWCNF